MARSHRAKKAAHFILERVLSHLDNKPPGLPSEPRQRFGNEIADRLWQPPVSLGKPWASSCPPTSGMNKRTTTHLYAGTN